MIQPMSGPRLSTETVHASTVALEGRAVLITGLSGSGKSDLALRLLDRVFGLVSDDRTIIRRGDVIVSVNGAAIARTHDLERATEQPSRSWQIVIRRGGPQISAVFNG